MPHRHNKQGLMSTPEIGPWKRFLLITATACTAAGGSLAGPGPQEAKVSRWWWDSQRGTDVTRLTDKNFDDFVASKDFVMVEFFLPNCEPCSKLAPVYDRIASTLLSSRNDIAFGRVNCGKDQSFRGPTPEEIDNGIDSPGYDPERDDDQLVDGQIVCDWYGMPEDVPLPAVVRFCYDFALCLDNS